jgi:uncharacterized protein YacL
MELFFNIIHYCFYKADCRMHYLLNKINPFVLIGRMPAIKKNLEKQGTNLLDISNKLWEDKRYGVSIMLSGGGLVIALFLIILAVFDILNGVSLNPIKSSGLPFLFCAFLAYIICHYTVFKGEKYLRYFKNFEKWSKAEKWKYGLITFFYVAGCIILWIFSFRFLPKQ